MTSTELVYASASLEDRKNYALALSRAGDLVPKGFRDRDGSANPGKILLAAEYGNMLGLHPMAALTGINVIDGKPSLAPALMSALVRAAGHKLRVKTTGTVAGKDIRVTVTLVRADDPDNPFETTWDIDRAKRGDLWGKPGAWSKYPESMLKWRAISEVCRDGATDVLLGANYVPEELGGEVNESGEVVDLTATVIDRTPAKTVQVEQDEDGPAVVDTMRDTKPAPKPVRKVDTGAWVQRITAAPDFPALTDLRKAAVTADVLLATHDGHTLGEWFDRQRDILNQAAAGEPEPDEDEPDEPLFDESELV